LVFTDKQTERTAWSRQYAHKFFKENSNWLTLGMPDDSVFQNFYNAEQAGNTGKFASVNDFIEQLDVQNAMNANNVVLPANLMETNRKTVNEVYINSWMQGILSFTSSDSSNLLNIALQDPIDGGNAVYSARVMLQLDPDNMGNGRLEENIFGNGSDSPELAETPFVKIYPNPNNGVMQVEYSLAEGQRGELRLYDLTGRKIKNYSLSEGINNNLSISEGALENGVYFYEVIVNDVAGDNGKIVIIK